MKIGSGADNGDTGARLERGQLRNRESHRVRVVCGALDVVADGSG